MYCPVCHADYPADWKVCPKDETGLLRSKQIGKYGITGLLGVGGMGAVYRAVNPDTQGAVAIKVMNAAVATSDSARQRFQREAAVVAKLRTSHVVKIYDFGAESDGTMYLVMELMDGHQLRDEITPAPHTMELARVQMVMDGALKGLGAAHKAGIVHRDLKPENVYVADTDDGEVPKLLDFGIARVRSPDKDLTRTGSLMGTASYMAPEQVTGAHDTVGAWTDVFAMGAILYEMLTGAPCFGGNTVTEVLHRVLRSEHVPLASVRTGLSPAVYAFVERCLDPDASKRPQDAEAMRLALAQAQLVMPGVVIPPASRTKPDHRAAGSEPGPGWSASANADGSGLAKTAAADAVVKPYQPPSQPALTPPPRLTPQPAVTPAPDLPRKSGARWPLALAGVVVLGVGAGIAIKLAGPSTPAPTPAPTPTPTPTPVAVLADAAMAATAGSAAVPADPWAAKHADERSTMIHLAAGPYDLGERTPGNALALPATHVTLGELWIDPIEMTLADLREALADPQAGGLPGDAGTLPARNITFAQAEDACGAQGKRLPTELEWEAVALTTPQNGKLATMKQALVASKRAECSAAGLCDMLGSVAEWTSTDFAGKGAAKGQKVVRGSTYAVSPQMGGWEATIHARSGQARAQRDPEIGVRCVVDPDPETPKATP